MIVNTTDKKVNIKVADLVLASCRKREVFQRFDKALKDDNTFVQDLVKIPGNFSIGQGNVFQADDLLHAHIITGSGDLIHAAADDAKSQKSDIHKFFLRYV